MWCVFFFFKDFVLIVGFMCKYNLGGWMVLIFEHWIRSQESYFLTFPEIFSVTIDKRQNTAESHSFGSFLYLA